MFFTNILLKKAKSKEVLVKVQSIASGHALMRVRPRVADKLELVLFDPFVQAEVIYREKKKVRSLKN